MKNQAMQHAIATAHKKAEEKKTDTLSLPHNKRATDADAQKPANDAMPQAAEKALQVAAQALHDGATSTVTQIKPSSAGKPVELGDVPAIVPRIDLLQNRVLFLVKTENIETGEISYFNVKDGTINVAPVEYYRSTKPVEEDDVISKMVNQFMSKTGSKNVILRKRLIKNHMLERDSEGKVDAKGLDALQASLLKAVKQFEQAIAEAFKSAA